MTLIKTSILTSISTIIKMACSFLIAKVLAVFLGPSGFAMMGQFQNFIQVTQNFSGSMLGHGVVKYVAEYKNDELKKAKILSTAFAISLVTSIIIGIILFLFRYYLASKLFNNIHYSIIVGLFAVTFTFYVINTLFLEVMNGEQDITLLTSCNIITNILALLLTILLITQYHVMGGLLVLVFNPVLVFFVSLPLILKSQWFKLKLFFNLPSKEWLLNLSRYAVMTITSAILAPVVQLFLRAHIIHTLSWQDAGYWDAITRISDVYLTLITLTLGIYYLPKLAELVYGSEIKREIIYGYKIILPIAMLLALTIFIFKEKIIELLFSQQFLPMMALFKYQLMGDVVKVAAWLLSYVMMAKAMVRLFVFTELVFSGTYVLLAVILMHYLGLVGITMAFALNYSLYWVFMLIYLWSYLKPIEAA